MNTVTIDPGTPVAPGAGLLRRLRANLGIMLAIVFLGSLLAAAFVPEPLAPLSRSGAGGSGRMAWLAALLPSDPQTLRVLTDVLHAASPTLTVSLAAAVGALLLGAPVGMMASARVLAWIGRPLQGVLTIVEAFPPLVLALTVVVALDALESMRPGWKAPGAVSLSMVLAFLLAPRIAQIASKEIRRARGEGHFAAARVLGASAARMMIHILVRRCPRPLVAGTAGLVGVAMLLETSLSFLGFGMPQSMPTWGTLLAAGMRPMLAAQWLPIVAPAALLLLTLLAVNFLAHALRLRLELRGTG